MESWRGRGRQAGRDALARLVTAWKAGSDPGGPGPDGLAGPGRGGGGLNGAAVAVPAGQPEQGWVVAVILLGVLIVEDQLEGHLLQPQVVGRVIRLHPLAIILSLAVGGLLAVVAGAVVAVPIVAVITRAVPELRRRDPAPGGP